MQCTAGGGTCCSHATRGGMMAEFRSPCRRWGRSVATFTHLAIGVVWVALGFVGVGRDLWGTMVLEFLYASIWATVTIYISSGLSWRMCVTGGTAAIFGGLRGRRVIQFETIDVSAVRIGPRVPCADYQIGHYPVLEFKDGTSIELLFLQRGALSEAQVLTCQIATALQLEAAP